MKIKRSAMILKNLLLGSLLLILLSSCVKQKRIALIQVNNFCDIYQPLPDSLLAKIELMENFKVLDIENLNHNEQFYLKKCDES